MSGVNIPVLWVGMIGNLILTVGDGENANIAVSYNYGRMLQVIGLQCEKAIPIPMSRLHWMDDLPEGIKKNERRKIEKISAATA